MGDLVGRLAVLECVGGVLVLLTLTNISSITVTRRGARIIRRFNIVRIRSGCRMVAGPF